MAFSPAASGKARAPSSMRHATDSVDLPELGHDAQSPAYDIGRLPVHPEGGAPLRPQAQRRGGEGRHQADSPEPAFHDFGTLQTLPVPATAASRVDIPGGSVETEAEIDDQPVVGGTTGATATASEGCGEPRSMQKQTSGAFLGGLTIDDYYPDLASRGYPRTAGPFDTGSRVGANIQLNGVIPSPCEPDQYHLEQTVHRTRFRINGSRHAREGERADDIAKSGRDASTAPFRQEFLGGGAAPLGYIISMADPPSTGYNSSSDIEHDRDFVTTLVGPSGRKSVSWSLSTRVAGGVVTTNVLS